jgi:serine/threonine-protein kinase
MSMLAVETTKGRSSSRILRDPLPGTGYRALRRIGAGTSSEVFEAMGPDRVRRAVKVLRAAFADEPELVGRLEREGLALSALDHPNLVPVIDVGTTAAGRPYFAMPLLEGETVRERLHRAGRIAPAVACAIAVEMLDGLDAAHRAGIVHRDIKPANLFLPTRRLGEEARRCVLLDFGVAALVGAPSGLTSESHVVGTPRYLAPEQILGGRVDERTDVYAAGLTLFEMIAGRSPYDARGPVDVMRAHLAATPHGLREFASVSPELQHALERAIAKPPARRWPSARAFAAVLERAAPREVQRAREVQAARARATAALDACVLIDLETAP